jgi:biotin-(acetyl-CoA carboxylase) ligase
VGVNVAIPDEDFPADLRWPATSVRRGADVASMLRAVCERLDRWVEAPPGDVLAGFRQRDVLVGRPLRWTGGAGGAPSGEGVGAGVDERGNLLVRPRSGGLVALGAGEVQLALGRAGAAS